MSCLPVYYAELLSNLRIIWLTITLPTPSNPSTKLIPSTPDLLFLHHDSKIYPIRLPSPLPRESLKAFDIPPPPDETTLSYRLPIDASVLKDGGNTVPWSASSMTDVSIHCKSCRAETVPVGKVPTWKNLPSGNWAEMMDFWHCHKPHSHDAGCANPGKTDAFSGGFAAEPGIGLVDLTYFLLNPGDCGNVVQAQSETSTEEGKQKSPLVCKNCSARLGFVDILDGVTRGRRLNKWTLCTKSSGSPSFTSYPLESFISAHLLSLTASEGAHKFLIIPASPDTTLRLKLWLFNTDIRYTRSLPTDSPSSHPQIAPSESVRAMKVYYQSTPEDEVVDTDALKRGSFEVVSMEEVEELLRILKESGEVLPVGARSMGVWRIGLLRFEE
ncbi:hypothetical protein RUND412_008614 [Rhizina undulata]